MMHLRDVPLDRLPAALEAAGIDRPAETAHRVGLAVHRDGSLDWDEAAGATPVPPSTTKMVLGKPLRAALARHFALTPQLTVADERAGSDGASYKWMFRLASGHPVEAVAIRHYDDHTLCVSSQAGCAMACTFCATGALGLQRNLTAGEITEMVVRAQRALGRRITDIVFMGMGEPLHNLDAVLDACTNLNHAAGHSIARKRITISTAGLVKEIRRLTAERHRWRLHVSLHSAIQETRARIMPISRTNPLPELLDAVREHQRELGVKWITFQYVALPGVNMDQEHVDALARELQGIRYILNVIPWNETGAAFRAPTWDEVKQFTTKLRALRCPVKVRYSAGKQDGMGCGQLAAETLSFEPTGGHMVAPPGIFTT